MSTCLLRKHVDRGLVSAPLGSGLHSLLLSSKPRQCCLFLCEPEECASLVTRKRHTSGHTHYTVQYARYGEVVSDSKRANWREVQHCTRTLRKWCDLSKETWDIDQSYYAKVRAVGKGASSKWAMTTWRFDPMPDTSFGPPLVSVEIQDNSAIINVEGPMRYQPNNNTPALSMATFYPQMTYNLSIHNTQLGQKHHFMVKAGMFTYPMMAYDTEYCFSAKARFLNMPIHCRSSEWHCITTPKDPVIGQLQRVVVGIVVPSVCICALLLISYFLCTYVMGKGQKSPYVLNPPSFHPSPVTFTSVENPNIIVITIESSSNKEPACPLQPNLRCTDPPPRYSPQSPRESMEPWDDLSIDYGVVAMAPKLSVVREEDDRGKDISELKGKCLKCDSKPEWRVDNGQISGFYAPQARPCLPVRSTPICTQTQAQTETSTLSQAHAWSQVNSGLPTQTQEENENEGLFINKNPQTGLFNISFNVQTNQEAGLGKVKDNRLDGNAEQGNENEKVPLLSSYASQNRTNMPHFHTETPNVLADDYCVVTAAAEHSVEESEVDYYDEDKVVCINWDPESRKLLVPGMKMDLNQHSGMGGVNGSTQGEKENRDTLRLENVFVRQSSEEEKETRALREMGGGGATAFEMDDFISKWKLVIPVDQ